VNAQNTKTHEDKEHSKDLVYYQIKYNIHINLDISGLLSTATRDRGLFGNLPLGKKAD
jgi:hypothetical protein